MAQTQSTETFRLQDQEHATLGVKNEIDYSRKLLFLLTRFSNETINQFLFLRPNKIDLFEAESNQIDLPLKIVQNWINR